jgi:hypothetical protein
VATRPAKNQSGKKESGQENERAKKEKKRRRKQRNAGCSLIEQAQGRYRTTPMESGSVKGVDGEIRSKIK